MPIDSEKWKGKTIQDMGSGPDYLWIKFTDGTSITVHSYSRPILDIEIKEK